MHGLLVGAGIGFGVGLVIAVIIAMIVTFYAATHFDAFDLTGKKLAAGFLAVPVMSILLGVLGAFGMF